MVRVHFGKWDDRFCGVRGTHRITVYDHEVTCPKCLRRYGQDRMYLTPQGQAAVDAIKAARGE